MKVDRIRLNCRQKRPVEGSSGTEPSLFFIRTPAIFTTAEGEVRIDGPSAVIFTSGYRQSIRPAGEQGLRYDMVSFRTSAADRQYMTAMGLPIDRPVHMKDSVTVADLLRAMRSQMVNGGRNRREFAELAMRLIFIAVCDGAEPVPEENELPRYEELRALREAIYDDPMNPWSVEEMCSDMGVSRTYFHRLYLKAFGVTCRQDVIESRLLYAAELLKNTDMSVSEVAEQCGYDSDSYFMRQFKQHKGCTPSEYRRRRTHDD